MQKLVIIGGGASGIFCAVNAARLCPQLKVIVLEKSGKLLSKVKVSGGGRCNVTHAAFEVNKLVENYPRGKNFLKKAFFLFSPSDTIQWFQERGVPLKTEKDGRIFPLSNSSQTIIDCLLQEVKKYAVEIRMNSAVTGIDMSGGQYIVETGPEKITAAFLVIASGGFPKLSQFGWMEKLQHTVQPPVPSLFTFNTTDKSITRLPGVSVPAAEVKIAGSKLRQTGPLLITHWGFSGPAVLKLSAWGARLLNEKNYAFNIHINWTLKYNENTLREDWNALRSRFAAQKIGNKNPFELPSRLWLYLLGKAGVNAEALWSNMAAKSQNRLIQLLTGDEDEIAGKTTFKEEFVTAGGVSLTEIEATTMQSRVHKNLFFTGEIMDVDGITGGFNFQHAWSSAMIAARAIAQHVQEGE